MEARPPAPSLSQFTRRDRQELRDLLKERSLLQGSITLSHGQQSSFYFDCKRVTLHPRGARLVADAFLAVIDALPIRPDAIGGLTHGADPIVGAVQMRALERGVEYEGFYVRKEPKQHGTRQWIENPPPAASKVVIVEDVVTTGGSVTQAAERSIEHGYEILAVVCLIDRNPGGSKTLRESFGCYRYIFSIEDFLESADAPKRAT